MKMEEDQGTVNFTSNVKREEEGGGTVTKGQQRLLELDNSESPEQSAETKLQLWKDEKKIRQREKKIRQKERKKKRAELAKKAEEGEGVVREVEETGEQLSLTEVKGGEVGATQNQPLQVQPVPLKPGKKKNRRKEKKKPGLHPQSQPQPQPQQQSVVNLTHPDPIERPEVVVPPPPKVPEEQIVAEESRERNMIGPMEVAELRFSELAARLRLNPVLLLPSFSHPIHRNKRKRLEDLINSTTPCPLTSSTPPTVVTESDANNNRKKLRTDLKEVQSNKGGALLVNPNFSREEVWLPPELVRSNAKGSKGKAYSNPPTLEKKSTSVKPTEESLPIVIDSTGGLPVAPVTEFEEEPLPTPTTNLNRYGCNLLTPQQTTDEDFIPLSYKGEALPELQPWFDSSCYSVTLSPAQRLQGEMEALVQYLSPTEEEIKLRQWVFNQVRNVVKALWPTATVHMFGSFRTKLFIPTSDVDIVILIPELNPAELVPCLANLYSNLSSTIQLARSEIRKAAKVPIINFVELVTGLEVDININAASGIDSCRIVTHFIDQCPAVRCLNMVLKHFLELNNLNKVFTGGLSSYALTLLVISFLQVHPHVRSGQLDPMKNLGLLFVEFLELYGVCFNSNLVGITLTNGGRYYQRSNLTSLKQTVQNCSLELLDPQDESNNVASGSFNYFHVKTSFRRAYLDLTTAIRHYCRASSTGYPRPLLGAMLHIPPATLAHRARLHDAYRHLFTT